jgi:hypothetical protein
MNATLPLPPCIATSASKAKTCAMVVPPHSRSVSDHLALLNQ